MEPINVVLVHGAWADGSSWSKVIPLLQDKGFNVTAAQIPLTSIEDDVAITKRLLTAENGPTVLVGHSYGGIVVSGAGMSQERSSLMETSSSCTGDFRISACP
jgi:pimeloyl-ACP methyl ester carboxylesterase